METNKKQLKILELFCGTKSIGKVFEEQGYQVYSIDFDKKFNPTLCIDILKFDISMLPKEWQTLDVIWASPPCTEYSKAKSRGKRNIEYANSIVKKTLKIINELKPKYWFLENPQTGLLKKQPILNDFPNYQLGFKDVSYCKYGLPYRKQTRIWTNCSQWKPRPICRKDCKFMVGNRHEKNIANGRKEWGNKAFRLTEKYAIPKDLGLEILKEVNLDGN